jgi:hypothetical protein
LNMHRMPRIDKRIHARGSEPNPIFKITNFFWHTEIHMPLSQKTHEGLFTPRA